MEVNEVKLLMLDVDGVLTDGSIVIGDDREIKIFNVQDGLGIELARRAGLKVYFVTNRDSAAVRRRAEELGIDGALFGVVNKTVAVKQIAAQENIGYENAAFVGDDLIDLPPMEMVGCPIAVGNAVDEVKAAACYVTKKDGGHGAVREAVEWILKANGQWTTVLAEYLQERGVIEFDREA